VCASRDFQGEPFEPGFAGSSCKLSAVAGIYCLSTAFLLPFFSWHQYLNQAGLLALAKAFMQNFAYKIATNATKIHFATFLVFLFYFVFI